MFTEEQLIKLGLTQEQAQAVLAAQPTPPEMSTQVTALQTEIDDYKQQLADRDQQLNDLQKQAQGNEELQAQITALQEQNAQAATEYEHKLQQQQFDFALTEALRDAKAKNPTAVKALLQLDGIEFVDGKLKGLDKQLEALKGTDDYLFVADGLKGNTPPQGGGVAPKTMTKADFAKMSYADRIALTSENPNILSELQ